MLVNVNEFNVAIKNAKNHISKDKCRPVFTNLHLFTEDNNLIVEATDGFTLGKSTIPILEDKAEFDILIKDIQPVKTKANVIDIIYDPKEFTLNVDNIIYKLDPDTKNMLFLNSKQAIPDFDRYQKSKLEDNCILVNADYLIRALKNITNQIDKKHHTLVKITVGTDIMPIRLDSGNQVNLVLPCRKQ